VAAGLYLGWHSSGGAFSARSRLQSRAFWATLVFLVNAALFVLVGLSFHTFSSSASGPAGRLALTGAGVVLTVVLVRLLWMEGLGWSVRLRRGGDDGTPKQGWRQRLILGWSGMRGAITLAALLAVPLTTTDGHVLAGRDDIIYIGFAVIIVTLVAQGMTLPALVRRLGLSEHPSVLDAERRARLQITQAVLDHLGEATDQDGLPEELADGLRAQYLARLHRLEASADEVELEDEVATTAQAELALRRDLIALQRNTLSEMREQGRVEITTLRRIEHDLDLEEARVSPA
jgi:CPA1 family monovalent cation:H+ antiporter